MRHELDALRRPNKPDAVNPAMTLHLHAGSKWRGVTDLER